MAVISEPGFETVTNWTLEKSDSDDEGGQASDWKTEGTYSYFLGFSGVWGCTSIGCYVSLKQQITVPANFAIYVDVRLNLWTGNGQVAAQILFGSTVLKQWTVGNGLEQLNQYVDLSAYNGQTDYLKFRIIRLTDEAGSDRWNFDNIREGTTLTDIYVNSSTGNDTYAGDSCVAGHPVLTFAKAYSLLAPGGTIHCCNSGSDFSAETVTLNKSFSIDLNGANGYFYMPQAS